MQRERDREKEKEKGERELSLHPSREQLATEHALATSLKISERERERDMGTQWGLHNI